LIISRTGPCNFQGSDKLEPYPSLLKEMNQPLHFAGIEVFARAAGTMKLSNHIKSINLHIIESSNLCLPFIFSPSRFTFTLAPSHPSHLQETQVEGNSVILSAAITACQLGQQPQMARQLLKTARRQGIGPDVQAYTAAITACGTASGLMFQSGEWWFMVICTGFWVSFR